MTDALTDADAMYRGLLEDAPDAMVAIDQDGRIALVNHQTEALFGYRRDELIGQSVEILVPDGARSAHPGHRRHYLANPQTRPMGAGIELAARRKDGSEFPAEISLSAIDTVQGKLVSAAIRDGTERRQAAIISSSSDAIFAEDMTGAITSWNPAAAALYGYTSAEVRGRDISLLAAPECLEQARHAHLLAAAGDSLGEYETAHVRADGTTISVACTVSPIIDANGTTVGVATFAHDISERKRAAVDRQKLEDRVHQSERLESLGQLAGGIAHDFNNLLSVILNYASFVAEEITDNQAASEDVEEIRRAAERAARLTHQLLIFGRRDTAEPQLLDLDSVVLEVRNLLSRTLGEHIELDVRSSEAKPIVMADRGQLEQVLLNLALNARDAMPTGGRLTIETGIVDLDDQATRPHLDLTPGTYLRLAVSDTGTGMSAVVVDHAFEPFYSTKPKGEGAGLGLATVYGIVREAGGEVAIYSEVGLGTTISVYLPPAEDLNASRPVAQRNELPSGNGATVLVVEDELAIRRVTARILRRNGYQVIEADSGDEALAAAATQRFDVLLTDVVMPHMSGRELAERIHREHPLVHVLFMSGYSQGVLGSMPGFEDGVPLIQKPFTEQSLIEKVVEISQRSSVDRRS